MGFESVLNLLTGPLDGTVGDPDESGVGDDVEGVVVLVLDVLGAVDPDLGLLGVVADVVGAEHDLEELGVVHAVGRGQDPLLVCRRKKMEVNTGPDSLSR